MADLSNVEGILQDESDVRGIFYLKGPELLGDNPAPNPVLLQNLAPSEGASLLATQAVTFDLVVTAPAKLASGDGGRVIVWVLYPALGGQTEVVYDGEAFTSAFNGASQAIDTFVSGTFTKRTMKVVRNGGWPSRPRIFIHANTDLGGVNL